MTAAKEEGPAGEAAAREAYEKEIVAKVQTLARTEPKRSLKRAEREASDRKRADWQREVNEARAWLEEHGIKPREAMRIWWKRYGATLKTDRKYDSRRRVLRQLSISGYKPHSRLTASRSARWRRTCR